MSLDVHGTHIQTAPSARKQYPSTLSIAPLVSLSVILAVTFADSNLFAQVQAATTIEKPVLTPLSPTIELPSLGNTAEADRLMLREVGDQQVFSNDLDSAVKTKAPTAYISDEQNISSHSPMASPLSSQPNDDQQDALNENQTQLSRQTSIASDAWQFVQQSLRLSIPENEQVENYRKQYLREALWVSKILNRATPFVGHIVDELDKRYMPVELALLPAIESGYRPDVHSAMNAAGIWQIVPATAKEIGLERTQWFDGRADIVASTTAAIDYLSYLNAEFHGDWLLTLAAYNAGPGRVRGAIKRNNRNNLPTDFWSLQLPTETRNYVPKFLALVAMLRYDNVPGFEIPAIKRGKNFEQIDVRQRVSLDKIAEFSTISEKTLRLLNASLVHAVTPPSGPHILNVPLGHGEALLDSLSKASHKRAYSLPATHAVVAGDTLSSIANLYGISQRNLTSMNALENSLIKIGQKLSIRNSSGSADSIEYVVTIGDTLSKIADRFSVDINDIRNAQGEELASDVIHPGVRLSIAVESMETG